MDATDFIQTTVTTTLDATPYTSSELSLVIRLITAWSIDRGLELSSTAILARDNVISFIDSGLADRAPATRADYRSKLLRVAEALLPSELAPRRLTPLQASDPCAPYSRAEQQDLLLWARSQKRARRKDARILLALGLGAGLSSAEIGNARANDIIATTDGAVLVHVRDGRPRTVPVLRRWEKVLLQRAQELSGEEYLFVAGRKGCGKNLIGNFVNRNDATVHVQAQRLRNTWLVVQMTACTPLPELIEAAGVESLEALSRFLPFVERKDPRQSRRVLRAA